MEGAEEQRFQGDDLIRSAVVHKLTVIGEAAAQLSQEFCEQHPDVDWPDIVGFRNILVHEYFALNWSIVWVAANEEVPALRQKLEIIIETEFPELVVRKNETN